MMHSMHINIPPEEGGFIKFLKKGLSFLSISMVMALVFTSVASAAFGGFTVSGGSATLPAVGGTTATVSAVSILTTAVDGLDGADQLRVSIDTSTFPSVVFDQNVTSATIGGTCAAIAAAGSKTITYTSATVATINMGAAFDPDCGNGETATITGLKVATLYANSSVATAAMVTATASANDGGAFATAVATSTTSTRTVTAQDAAATVTIAGNSVVGVAGNTTLNLTIPLDLSTTNATDTLLDAGDTVTFTLPTSFSVTGTLTSSHTFDGGTFTTPCVAASQAITCTVATAITDANGTGTLVIAGITGGFVASAQTITDLALNDGDNGGADVGADTSVLFSAATTTGTLTSADIALSSIATNETIIADIAFTNPGSVTIAATDKIKVTFGSGFTVSGASGGTCSSMDGSFATSVSSQDVVITRSGGSAQSAAAETCSVTGIVNPNAAGDAGAYTITVTTSADAVRYTASSVTSDVITSSQHSSGNHSSSSSSSTTTTTDDTTVEDTTTDDTTVEDTTTDDTTVEDTTTEDTTTEDTTTDDTTVDDTTTDDTTVVNTTPFTDLTDSWGADYVNTLYEMKVVEGRTPTAFAPNENITRAEMVKIALVTFGYPVEAGKTPSFSDVKADDWFASYMAAAEVAGIVQAGENGKVRPNDPVNRAEALKIILVAGKFALGNAPATSFSDVMDDVWYASYVNFAFANGIVKGKSATMFAPGDYITRVEMAKIAVLAYQLSAGF